MEPLDNESALENGALEIAEETESEDDIAEDDVYDDAADQLHGYGFVGMRIKALYTNGGRFVGKIEHYNVVLDEYTVVFDDESVDFLRPDEIDGVEVMLLS